MPALVEPIEWVKKMKLMDPIKGFFFLKSFFKVIIVFLAQSELVVNYLAMRKKERYPLRSWLKTDSSSSDDSKLP